MTTTIISPDSCLDHIAPCAQGVPMLLSRLRRHPSVIVLSGLMALALTTPVQAGDDDNTALLNERVHAFLYAQASELGSEVNIEVHPPSAHLPTCENPRPFLPNANQSLAGRVSVGVRCGELGQQVRYMQATLAVIGEQVVTSRSIAAGTVIDASMLALRPAELGRLPNGAITEMAQAIGKQATRPIGEGRALTERQLKEVTLVERGARVRVEARGQGFSIAREGEALDNGAMDSEIRVRLDNRDILRARVIGRDRLEVDF
ncbi:flagellar basal body P-ring formation chaperone FlgA [Litchfieldella rifensis]|uniref:Flagella basal body P-ring formation protein FlgA n=1 Tax=Litchfieldella rifensis TaxID=762643 RepID=A0ABV7LS98_9GAMM